MKSPSKGPALTATISAAKGASRLQLLGKSLSIRGFYIADPPMLVQYPGLVNANTILPPGSYLMLSGAPPTGAQTGDEISLTGVLRRPGSNQASRLLRQSSVLEMAAGSRANVVRRMVTHATVRPDPALELNARVVAEGRPDFHPIAFQRKYAVLISAGDSASGMWRAHYAREIQDVRNLLLRKGYTSAGIFVLSGGPDTHGVALGQERAATLEAVRLLFDQLAAVMTDQSQLLVYTTGAGGGFYDHQMDRPDPSGVYGGVLDDNGDESHEWTLESLCGQDLNGDGDKSDRVAYDEVLQLYGDEYLTDDELASNVAKITHHGSMIFLMQQSFAGGFARDLAGPRRVTLAACSEKQWAYTMTYSPHSEFTHWLLDANDLRPPDCYGYMWALYLFIYSHDQARPLETPAYMATEEGFPHYGAWPSSSHPSVGCGWGYF